MGLRLFVRRVGAYLIDAAVLFAVLAPLAIFGEKLLGIRPRGGVHLWVVTALSFSLPVWAYFVLADASRSGATPGKRLMRLQVRFATGEGQLAFGLALVRTALKLAPWELVHLTLLALASTVGQAVQIAGLILAGLVGLAFLYVCLATGGRWSLHDMVVGTMVVDTHRAADAV